MGHRKVWVLAALSCVLLAASPARAQEQFDYPPGYDPNAPRTEAADKTLGMALMSATVSGNGTLLRGGGVVSSIRDSAGKYRVTFGRSVETCTCTASFGSSGYGGAYSAQNYISANCPYGSPDDVLVWIIKSGVDGDGDFQLLVFCPK